MNTVKHLEWPAHLKVLDGRLHSELLKHADQEAALVRSYAQLAQQSGSHYVRYLVDLIVADEKRHHALFEDWAHQLAEHASCPFLGDSLPDLRVIPGDHEALLAVTTRLLQAERNDVRKVKQFRKDTRGMRRTTVWPIILDMLARDAKTHIRVLKFIRKQLG